MPLTEHQLRQLASSHARDERRHLHLHLQAIREAARRSRASSPLRRRLGVSIVRLGSRVAGEPLGSPLPS